MGGIFSLFFLFFQANPEQSSERSLGKEHFIGAALGNNSTQVVHGAEDPEGLFQPLIPDLAGIGALKSPARNPPGFPARTGETFNIPVLPFGHFGTPNYLSELFPSHSYKKVGMKREIPVFWGLEQGIEYVDKEFCQENLSSFFSLPSSAVCKPESQNSIFPSL